ncbi:MAG: MFS transporter, partial [Chitinivibrionales bacterium]|nr:MFS transporter [Chitinivibrionales bacterium]MBD3395861.1 MFS transporter [Chitinivibrionales bacterium]
MADVQSTAGQAQPEQEKLGSNQYLFWMCFIALVTTAFSFASRAQVIGDIAGEFGLDETYKGWLLGAGMWPFAIGIVGFSLVVDRLGYKLGLFCAFACHALSTLMILFGPNFWWLFFGTLLVAVGNGIVEAVINPAVASLFKTGKTKWLNILHAGWAGGILLGSLVAIFLGDAPWRLKVGLIFIPMIIYGFMLLRAVFPASERVLAGVSYREMLREMGVIGFALVIFLVTKEIMNIFANLGWAFVGWEDTKMLAFALIPTIVLIIPIGAYVRSPGR